MKSKQILSFEQMHHLQELGLELDYNTLHQYVKFEDTGWLLKPFSDLNIIGISCKYIPAYALQDVLDMLPKEIKPNNTRYFLRIDLADECIYYYCDDHNFVEQRKKVIDCDGIGGLIDAAYKLLIWCIENGYIETNKNK